MKSKLLFIVSVFVFWLLAFAAERPIFLLSIDEASEYCFYDKLCTIIHGLPMDLSAAGYFTIPSLLILLFAAPLRNQSITSKILIATNAFLCVTTSIICFGDINLYPFWGFRLDTTPLFYLESPKNAAASASAGDWVAFLVSIIFLSALLILAYKRLHRLTFAASRNVLASILAVVISAPFVTLAIRGGLGVSTMNAGRVFFSQSAFLNNAAINPNWNFLYSLEKTDDYTDYKLSNQDEVDRYVSRMLSSAPSKPDTLLLRTSRPNIILFIMESFGGTACRLTGGEDAMPGLCRYAEEGVYFENFFANSFRTDRGVASILAAYPGMPRTSLMKLTARSQNVKKFPLSLREAGYSTSYYYGGDVNFTNMNSFLVMCGFQRIVRDRDFPKELRQSKWGALDHDLFLRFARDLRDSSLFASPYFATVMTSSSHEPFDVPYHHLQNPYLNSVAYTDSCLTAFLDDFSKSPEWNNTLIIILPDHGANYPAGNKNYELRHNHVPMVWTGGALSVSKMRVTKYCSQIDLAQTLLCQLGISDSSFTFSKNVFSDRDAEFAFFSFNNGFSIVNPTDSASYDYNASRSYYSSSDSLLRAGQSYLHAIYSDLERR